MSDSSQPDPPVASRAERAFAAVQRVLPTRLLSTLVHFLACWQWRPWKSLLIGLFRRAYRIDLRDAQIGKPAGYASFNAFFTRALKPGTRPQAADPALLTSPVDGCMSQFGPLRDGRLLQAKGRDYSLVELLAGDYELAGRLHGGSFATIYLAPHNYHRIHMPIGGRLRRWSYVPGRLFSVNPATARAMPRLFARNERLIAEFDTSAGPLLLVMVGALFVGSLETVWAGKVSPPHRRRSKPDHFDLLHPLDFARGAEIGRFNMGSTVILLAGPDLLRWRPGLNVGMELRVGTPLGALQAGAGAT